MVYTTTDNAANRSLPHRRSDDTTTYRRSYGAEAF